MNVRDRPLLGYGTLLTTARAGVYAWEDAVKELTGREFTLASVRIAGLTDFQIAVRTFEALGIDADETFLRRFVDRYGELLPGSLPRKQGRVMPNVREILDRLHGRTDVPVVPVDREHTRRRTRQADTLRPDALLP
jgi:phosphoglycolate phosphatase-like HAD superfamily hydrolase